MENYSIEKSANHYNSDEIDIVELFSAIWRTRYIAVIAVVLVSCLYFAYVYASYVLKSERVTYSSVVKLTFPGVEDSKYPNGSTFSYQDLIAPNIVAKVHEKYGLEKNDLSLNEFSSLLLVEPYSPQYPLIIKKYEKLLSSNNLSVEQLDQTREKMRLELDQATRGSAVVSLRTKQGRFSETQAKAILTEISKLWANSAIVDKGALEMDIKLASARSLDDDLFKQVDYMVISDILNDKVSQIESNIKTLMQFDGAATISDPITGLKLADLSESLSDLSKYVIDELMSPIRSLGLTRNKELSIYYYEDKKTSLERELALFENQSALVREAFDSYHSVSDQNVSNAPLPASAYTMGAPSGTQMTADALDKIVAMSGRDKAEEYKQMLNQQWLDLNMKASDTRAKIREADELIAALKGTGQTGLEATLKEEYLARAESTLPKILEKLRSYFDVTQRIYTQLGKETIGATGRLYQPVSNELLVSKPGYQLKKTLIIWAGLIMLCLFTVVPVAMLRNAMRKRAKLQEQVDSVLRKTIKPQPAEKVELRANA